MLKAHSLLYAIYVCLIVSLICGAMLYIATLYDQLNLTYLTREELYIKNQSLVNYALGNMDMPGEADDVAGEGNAFFETTPYGLLTVLKATTTNVRDTVTSVHFTGQYPDNKTCLYLSDYSTPLLYGGEVTLNGEQKLPPQKPSPKHLNGEKAKLNTSGKITPSGKRLPAVNTFVKQFLTEKRNPVQNLGDLKRVNDSLYYNSFKNPTIEIKISPGSMQNIHIKGNFILCCNNDLLIGKSCTLEDVIVIAPRITFESGFKGTLQCFAKTEITVEENVVLGYPSVVCIYNESVEKSNLNIKEHCKIIGAVVSTGFPIRMMESNFIDIGKEGLIVGDVYCEGMLSLYSNVYGAVYTSKLLYEGGATKQENMLFDVTIDIMKRPGYFVPFPLMENKNNSYGLIKRVS